MTIPREALPEPLPPILPIVGEEVVRILHMQLDANYYGTVQGAREVVQDHNPQFPNLVRRCASHMDMDVEVRNATSDIGALAYTLLKRQADVDVADHTSRHAQRVRARLALLDLAVLPSAVPGDFSRTSQELFERENPHLGTFMSMSVDRHPRDLPGHSRYDIIGCVYWGLGLLRMNNEALRKK